MQPFCNIAHLLCTENYAARAIETSTACRFREYHVLDGFPWEEKMRHRLLALVPAFVLAAAPLAWSAPTSAHADIVNELGARIGTAQFTAGAHGVRVTIEIAHIPPGKHGIHIHAIGKCDPPSFASAAGHFNPTSSHHGVNNPQTPHPHLGDMPNLTADKEGNARAHFVLAGVTLDDGPDSLFHQGGTAIVVHAGPDDLISDPSGNSGNRIACGIIQQ